MATNDNEDADEEKAFLVSEEGHKPEAVENGLSARFWVLAVINTIATAGIIFVNKRIFDDARLRHAQVAFAAFHFAVTGLLLFTVSRPAIGMFQPKPVSTTQLLPLAVSMILSVVLPNAALAYSTIQFYQVTRVLLTPCVAAINFMVTGATLPRAAALSLVPVCVGVAVISYFDTAPAASADPAKEEARTTHLGVLYAFLGVLASSVYAVWIKRCHQVFDCSSMQLLLNQAPVSVVIMVFAIPFTDDVSALGNVSKDLWGLIFLSGLLACIFNLSQYLIINEAGPVSSTVLGHAKRCLIIALGWIQSRRPLMDGSLVGVVLAVGGIILYSYIMQRVAST